MAARNMARKAEIGDTADDGAFSQYEVADYVADMAKELALLSNRAGLTSLETLLLAANKEASQMCRKLK